MSEEDPDKVAEDAEIKALQSIVEALEEFDAIVTRRILDSVSVFLGLREPGDWVDL